MPQVDIVHQMDRPQNKHVSPGGDGNRKAVGHSHMEAKLHTLAMSPEPRTSGPTSWRQILIAGDQGKDQGDVGLMVSEIGQV